MQHSLSIAPMMGYTDRHYRYLMRLIAPQALLYTEMLTTAAILRGDRDYLLRYSPQEHPLALQVGGNNPSDLACCARIAKDRGYDQINLNVGCPSSRVQSGQFGACLMKQPALVADCVSAMSHATDLPVTVKTRIGVDDQDSYEALQQFMAIVAQAGCDTFIIHARKAWLKGLSPRENRLIPPLRYDTVYQLKRDFPHLRIIINGGINDLSSVMQHMQHVDGVMIGREAYRNPLFIAQVQQLLLGVNDLLDRRAILMHYLSYIQEQYALGVPLRHLIQHLVGFFQGEQGAKAWRRCLSESVKTENDLELLLNKVA